MQFNVKTIVDEIVDQYVNDENPRPWIVGFSGGKDSTMLLQLVWTAIKYVVPELRKRRIFVVCNNTLVENPKIIEYTERVLEKIQEAAAKEGMPITVHRTTPKLEDTFWVNLIGRGYPAPNSIFRWCTERLKINPTTQFIVDRTNDLGEVIILLGTRMDESNTRANSLRKHEVRGHRLRKHVLPNAYVYAPIVNVATDDLWQYLMQAPSPWGASNKELVTLYKNASGGDCPLVIDKSTPSCGNSRFGCWVCTVVTRDRSMEALVENGEDWLEPLMELRDLLAESRNDPVYRESVRRDGSKEEGKLGPYKADFRALFLERLLRAQFEIHKHHPEMTLVDYQELVAIQVTWYRDNIFQHRVADIYNRVYGTSITIHVEEPGTSVEKDLLKEVCKDNPADFDLLSELLTLQRSRTLLMNNRGLQTDLENKLQRFSLTR